MDKYPKHISPEQQELFERFLLGQMTSEEAEEFRNTLETNEELNTQFNEFQELFLAIEEAGLRGRLDEFHEGVEHKGKVKKLNFNSYRIAASIAILISLGIWFYTRPGTNERLFNEYFSPDPGLPTVMGPNDHYTFYEAMVDYKLGNYESAIEKWKQLLAAKPQNDTLNYFLGVAHLAEGDSKTAIPLLSKVINSDSYFEKDALHYLGLAYIKNGKIDSAKIYLKDNDIIMNKILK